MANANAHFDPKVLTFLQDTSSVNPHADSGNARALEKSGALGRPNVAMYICLRTTLWTLLTLKGNLCGRYSIATRLRKQFSQLSKRRTGSHEWFQSSTTAASTGQRRL